LEREAASYFVQPGQLAPLEDAMEERRPTHEKPQLVRVFDTQDDAEAQVVRGLLESAGIEALLTGRDAPQDVLPGVGGVMVQVAPEQAEEARRLIEEHRRGGPEMAEAGFNTPEPEA
jgi:hypothetical protein